MKKKISIYLSVLYCCLSTQIYAAATGTVTLTYSVPPVSVVRFDDVTLPVFGLAGGAGTNFGQQANIPGLYVTNNAGPSSRKITAQLASAAPTGISVFVVASLPGLNASYLAIGSTSPTVVLSGIGNGAFQGALICYLSADVATAAITSGTSIPITLTLIPS